MGKKNKHIKKVTIGDSFLYNSTIWKVISPYKVKGHWIVIDVADNKNIRIFSGGTIALHRIRKPEMKGNSENGNTG